MDSKADPLTVLLAVKAEQNLEIEKELIEQCYQLQSEHQYDKDRDTLRKMRALVEEKVKIRTGESLL
ncbi:DNA modification system-associated small protein [Amphritea pacifica]|uniref:DNA modification system-associated small protein n=1 Tax=Amphritea pacifica TaxID=2811233 RepID=UPI0019657D13|nr:DNA modification system-associated small protein [Amphritea pacifica]MBN1009089.1 hypothetical protein [Amphritea pacifica]